MFVLERQTPSAWGFAVDVLIAYIKRHVADCGSHLHDRRGQVRMEMLPVESCRCGWHHVREVVCLRWWFHQAPLQQHLQGAKASVVEPMQGSQLIDLYAEHEAKG